MLSIAIMSVQYLRQMLLNMDVEVVAGEAVLLLLTIQWEQMVFKES